MEELERVYVQSYERGEKDEAWRGQCRQELVKLQSGDPENVRLWKEFMELSLRELDMMYGRLGVKYDLVRGESHYNDRLQGVVDMHYRERGAEKIVQLSAGDMFVAGVGDEHVAHPVGEARVLVIEREGSV